MAKVLLKVGPGGDPNKAANEQMLLTAHGPLDKSFDIRDHLAALVGKGNTLNPDDKAAIYSDLINNLGKDKAIKVMNHAYIFNQRPEVQRLSLDDKLRSFYSIGSNDPDVNNIISKSKSLGYGPVQGFRESSSAINQVLNGKVPGDVVTTTDPSLKKRVLLKVAR